MTDQEAFTTYLRRHRQRSGMTLPGLAAATRIRIELLDGLERNDLEGWPRGLYARAYVRDYATAVGLDPEETVDEFCRLFPHGDRRGHATMEDIASIVATVGEFKDEFPHTERRQSILRAQTAQVAVRPARTAWHHTVLDAAKSAGDAVVGFARRRAGVKPT